MLEIVKYATEEVGSDEDASSYMLDDRSTDPQELSKVKNIVQQFSLSAKELGLEVFTNQKRITDYRYKFSKYQPDLASFPQSNTVIGSKVTSKWLLMNSDDERDVGDLCASLDNIFLEGEGKKQHSTSKDPIGQLLAGTDKTLADLVARSLKEQDEILQKCTFYALYFIPETDECEVYKLNVQIGKKTCAFKGNQRLKIQDAFNRVVAEMVFS